MAEFTDQQITRMAQQAELQLAAEIDCISERFSIAVTAGVSEYTLPATQTIININRIMWKGKKLEPQSGNELIWSGSSPQSSTQGLPRFYIYSFQGYCVFRLYPAPPENLAAATGDLWHPDKVRTALIIEAEIGPDFNTQDLRIPAIIRRQYVKDYVMYRLLKREGKMMDPKAAEYYYTKFEADKQEHRMAVSQLMSCVPLELAPSTGKNQYIGRPVLPPQFGEICE